MYGSGNGISTHESIYNINVAEIVSISSQLWRKFSWAPRWRFPRPPSKFEETNAVIYGQLPFAEYNDQHMLLGGDWNMFFPYIGKFIIPTD